MAILWGDCGATLADEGPGPQPFLTNLHFPNPAPSSFSHVSHLDQWNDISDSQ